MKAHNLILLLFPIIFLFCSHTTKPENNAISQNIQLEFLKRIFQLEVNNNWKYEELNYYKRTGEDLLSWSTEAEFCQKLKDENNDISFLIFYSIRILVHKSQRGLAAIALDS